MGSIGLTRASEICRRIKPGKDLSIWWSERKISVSWQKLQLELAWPEYPTYSENVLKIVIVANPLKEIVSESREPQFPIDEGTAMSDMQVLLDKRDERPAICLQSPR